MKILQVLAGAEHGGAETAFVDMCIALKEAGEDVHVATRANDLRVPKLKKASIPVYTLRFGGKFDFYTPYALGQVVRCVQPDIVQSWMSRASRHVRRWKVGMGIPKYHVVSRLGGYYKIKNFKNTDFFSTITPDIKRYLIEDCAVATGRVRHINNFAETEKVYTPIDRAEYGVPEDAVLCLGLGRLHSSKAFDTLIKAVAGAPDTYLWIAGEGPDRAELGALITELGVDDRVRLLGWRDDRAALLEAVDICVFSSRYEPFGTVFVQAWAQKTPLLSTDSDGPRQFVRHEEDGLITPIDDVEAMRVGILRLSNDKELASKIVGNAYQRYLLEFSKGRTVEAYQRYYREIMSDCVL